MQQRLFVCLAGASLLAGSLYAIAHFAQGRIELGSLCVGIVVVNFYAVSWAVRTGRFAWPLRVLCTVPFLLLCWTTLRQGPDIPAAGWWLSIIPFIMAGSGFHRLALVAVGMFLSVVTAVHFGLPGWLGLKAEPTVEPWRRFLAVVGSETLALVLILVSMQARGGFARVLDAARAAAKDAMDIKARFLANISHEIRTPLNGIVGASELMESPTVTPQQLSQLLRVQHVSSKALLALVNDVLDVAKLDAGRVELELAPLSLRDVVFEANELLGVQAYAKGIELTSSCDPDVPESFFGDATRVRQIVNNLVSNAVKFTAVGGVHIHLSIGNAPRDLSPSMRGRPFVRIEVKDSGLGISDVQLARLFTPFVQADSSTHRRFGGTGLGLSIAKELAKLMGGTIEVASVAGAGSTFCFVAPMAVAAAARLQPEPSARDDIFLVTTDSGLQRHIRSLLNDLDIEPVCTASVPSGADLDRCRLLLVDDAVLKSSGVPVFDGRLAHAQRVVVFTTLGAMPPDPIAQNAAIVYKPVRRRSLQTVLGDANPLPAEAQSTPDERNDASLLSGLRVLVADDNAVNRILAEAMLTELGCSTVLASDGRKALEKALAQPFDVVLMDVLMPDMDGVAATREIRLAESRTGTRQLPIVAMTANCDVDDTQAYVAVGMNALLLKPFSLASLRDCLLKVSRTVDAEPPAG